MAQQSQTEEIELNKKIPGMHQQKKQHKMVDLNNKNQRDTWSTISLPLSETPTLKPSDVEKNPPKPKTESLWPR